MSAARPTVVIVGGGFGGLRAARALRRAPVRVVLIDRRNYHLFQPLLYQVATAGLEPGQIARSIRAILRRQRNLEFRLSEVTALRLAERTLETDAGPVQYDYLILAIGGETNFFGLDSIRQDGLGLKDIREAVRIRNHVLEQFERAMLETDATRRRARLTFVVVGGGPTGVEMAGALAELIRLVLVKDYPALNLADTRVVLVEAADRLLGAMPARLSAAALRMLAKKHVEIRLGESVVSFDGHCVRLRTGETIAARTIIWAAGVQAASLEHGLDGLATARQRRIVVTPTLQTPSHPEVFVIGDAASLEHAGEALPMMAPVALQQAETAAENIRRLLAGTEPVPFRYSDPGSLATIGRHAAVAYVKRVEFTGFVAWVVWLVVHLIQLIGFRNKLFVLLSWAWDYFLYERSVRLISTR